MSSEWGVRGRILVNEWFAVVVVVGLLMTAAGGYAAYTAYQTPGTTTEERQVSSWEANGTYTLSARVSEQNPLYPVGTELRDRPAYFLSISPVTDGTFQFSYRATEGGSATVTVSQTLVLRAIETQSGDGDEEVVEYWRLSEPIGSAQATDVAPGESVSRSFQRNVNRTYTRMQGVAERLGGTPGTTQMLVVSTVEFRGTVNGNEVTRTGRYRLPIEVSGTTYQPGEVEGTSLSGSTTERITRQRTYGPLYRIGGPLAALLGCLVLAGLGAGRYTGRLAVSDAERAALDFRSTRKEFDDWITTARLPQAVLDRPRVETDSLEGLVDTAIDVDGRVFEDPDDGTFHVPHENLRYVYAPTATGIDEILGGDRGEASAEGETEAERDAEGDGESSTEGTATDTESSRDDG
jgi:hypothetical protein